MMTDKESVYPNNMMINKEAVLRMIYNTALLFVQLKMTMQDITFLTQAYKYYKTQVVESNLIKLIRKWNYQALLLDLSFKEK